MTQPEHTAITTRGLTKSYGDFTALDDLDLEVRTGEIFGFLGPNGAGKSTTIRTLLDQIRPTSGSAQVLGRDTHAESLSIRADVGYVPGDLALYPKLTGEQTLRYFAKLRGGVDQSYVRELAERLDADLTKKVGAYSTGNRQKIGLIQAFMHRPALLILDEPNAGLDPLVQQEFHTMLREVRNDGRTVFLSSHTLSEVERVADRVAIIRHGVLAAVESITDLKAKAVRRVELEFAEDAREDFVAGVEGIHDLSIEGHHLEVAFEGHVREILEAALRHDLVDLHTRDADLEEIFLAYYHDDEPPSPKRTEDEQTGQAGQTGQTGRGERQGAHHVG